MGKCLNTVKLTETLSLSECTDGFYLYDYTRGMNLAMYAKSREDALVESITYYQKRLEKESKALETIRAKVEGFVNLFVKEVEYGSSTDIPDTILEIQI